MTVCWRALPKWHTPCETKLEPQFNFAAHIQHGRNFFMTNYDQVFWLTVTNIVLGLVTLSCVLVIGYAAIKEIRERARARKQSEIDDRTFIVTGLGVTMADGGKKKDDDAILVVTEEGIETVKANKKARGS